jgi:hypothetical protein
VVVVEKKRGGGGGGGRSGGERGEVRRWRSERKSEGGEWRL